MTRPLVLLFVFASAACGGPGQTGPVADFAALPAVAPAPVGGETTPKRVALGRLLFWDPVLSGKQDVACATCHHPAFGYSDGRATSAGVGWVGLGPSRRPASSAAFPAVSRNAPTVVDTAWNGYIDEALGLPDPATAPMFWDGRAVSLETQAAGPIAAAPEMRGNAFPETESHAIVVGRLAEIPEYVQLFADAWGPGPITKARLTASIAAFERTLVSPDTSFDKYLRGDTSALTQQQRRGLQEFQQAGCDGCHSGPMLSDYDFHDLGVERGSDVGDGSGRFRTPSLRNVTRTAPYFHNGSAATLGDVLGVYRRLGGRGNGADRGDPKIQALRVGRGDADTIIAFLESVSDGTYDTSVPRSVPSGGEVGGNIGR